MRTKHMITSGMCGMHGKVQTRVAVRQTTFLIATLEVLKHLEATFRPAQYAVVIVHIPSQRAWVPFVSYDNCWYVSYSKLILGPVSTSICNRSTLYNPGSLHLVSEAGPCPLACHPPLFLSGGVCLKCCDHLHRCSGMVLRATPDPDENDARESLFRL